MPKLVRWDISKVGRLLDGGGIEDVEGGSTEQRRSKNQAASPRIGFSSVEITKPERRRESMLRRWGKGYDRRAP